MYVNTYIVLTIATTISKLQCVNMVKMIFCGIHDGDDFCCIATQMGGWGDDSWENDTEWDDAGGIERYRHHIQHHHHDRHHIF